MKSYSALLLTAAVTVVADNTWEKWTSSAAPAPSPAPEVGWTDWVTTTDYKTVYETVTLPPVTVTLPAVTKTETTTETVTLPPVTVVSVSGSVLTVENTVVNTVVNTATSTEIQQVSVTSISVVNNVVTSSVTVVSSVSYCPPTLTGLVTCETRTINPTYTTSTPLPSTYLWGCPPGKLCHPPKVNCNFEQNPPADTYYCSPDECIDVAPLPPIQLTEDFPDVNSTCAWYTPTDDYFNINPEYFDLNYNIFRTLGNKECTYIPTVTVTVTIPTTVAIPTTIVDVSTVVVPSEVLVPTVQVVPTTIIVPSEKVVPTTVVVSSEVVVPTTVVVPSEVVVPTTVTVSSWIEWTTTAPAPAPVVVTSSGWDNWHSSKREAQPEVSARAELVDRELAARAQEVIAPPQCFSVCNDACQIVQSVGLMGDLCDGGGDFDKAMSNVRACTSKYTKYSNVATQINGLGTALRVCSNIKAKRDMSLMARQATSDTASTVEASDFSTSSVSPSASASSVSSEASSAASSVASSASSAASAAASSASNASPGSSASSASSAAASISSSAASAASSAVSSASSVASSATSAASSAATAGSKASHVQVMNSVWAFFLPILALFVRI